MKAFMHFIILFCGVVVSARKLTRRTTLTFEEENAPCKTEEFFEVLGSKKEQISNAEWTKFFTRVHKTIDQAELASEMHDLLKKAAGVSPDGKISAKDWDSYFGKVFKEIDPDGDKVMTMKEFDEWGEKDRKKNYAMKLALKSMGCGFCTQDEFFKELNKKAGGGIDKIASKQWTDYFSALFASLDDDKGGSIDKKELRSDFLMKKIDTSGDGSISKDEWNAFFKNLYKDMAKGDTLTAANFRGYKAKGATKFGVRAYVCATSRGD